MAFQKDSDLVSAFNYHIHKMHATGNMERFWQHIIRKRNMNRDDTKLQNANVVGYENVAFPFLALLTGVFAAFLILGTEGVAFCKSKYADNANQYCDENSTRREARLLIKEVCDMLQENNSNLKQSTIREVREILEKINQILQETNSK